jgi:hypothetical protein
MGVKVFVLVSYFIIDYAFNSAYVMVELFTQAVRIRSNI